MHFYTKLQNKTIQKNQLNIYGLQLKLIFKKCVKSLSISIYPLFFTSILLVGSEYLSENSVQEIIEHKIYKTENEIQRKHRE